MLCLLLNLPKIWVVLQNCCFATKDALFCRAIYDHLNKFGTQPKFVTINRPNVGRKPLIPMSHPPESNPAFNSHKTAMTTCRSATESRTDSPRIFYTIARIEWKNCLGFNSLSFWQRQHVTRDDHITMGGHLPARTQYGLWMIDYQINPLFFFG